MRLEDDSGAIDLIFFNQPWMAKAVEIDAEVDVMGRVVDARGPAISEVRLATAERPLPRPGALLPQYPLTRGIGQPFLRALVLEAVDQHADLLVDPVPREALAAQGLQ